MTLFLQVHKLMDKIMALRTTRLMERLIPYLSNEAQILDVGSGTGHLGVALEGQLSCKVTPIDVADLRRVGTNPILFDGTHLTFDEQVFSHATLIDMMHYCSDPIVLFKELHRVVAGTLLINQSTYSHPLSEKALAIREFFWGRFAFWISRSIGYVKKAPSSMSNVDLMEHHKLNHIFTQAGWKIRHHQYRNWLCTGVKRNLYILEKAQ